MTLRPTLLATTSLILRVLIGLTFLYCAGIAALLVTSFIAPVWLPQALGFGASAPASHLTAIRIIMVIGLAAAPLTYGIFSRLLAIVQTVRDGDAFIPDNARRLQAIAQAQLGLQVMHLLVGGVCLIVSTPEAPFDLHLEGGSVDGWLAVLLTFILARVFDVGTRMRADLEGTV